ncbi:hypothetical protein F0562_028686 [Nyssa sinensis]|uniref:RING-type E3 ubiquitin transferase n=1 Tax=Nyssa sinensis TaxID=561372 RepID=A0A5J5B0W0_9ASTE|nr:hypothetical protein F0562_028686 [Nyssa sinensis]
MQGQRRIADLFPETLDLNQGSVSNNAGMNQSTAWNNMPNPVESRLSNYMLSSGEGNYTCTNDVSHNIRSFSGRDLGESSSSANLQNQFIGDGLKLEYGRTSSFIACTGVDTKLEERRFEPSNIFIHESISSGLSGNEATGRPLIMQSSSTARIPLNVNLNAGYVGHSDDRQAMGAGGCPNLYKLDGSETEWISSASASNNIGTSSGNSGYLVENDGGSGSSLSNWGLSCKRKAFEGTSGQSYPGASSSFFPQAENAVRHTVPARYNSSSSLRISSPPVSSPSVSPTEELSLRTGVGIRGVAPDVVHLNATGIAESSSVNFGVGVNPGYQESIQFNLPLTGNATRQSNVCSPHLSSRTLSNTDSLDLRATASSTTNSSNPPNQSHSMHNPGLSGNMLPFPWIGSLNSRGGNSSSPFILSGERGAPPRDDANIRSTQRSNAEHPMFIPATEMRNLSQDPTNWSLATGNSSTSGGVPSCSRIGPSSSRCPFPAAWIPHHNPQTQNQQRLSEFAPWTLFPSVDSESGGQRGHFPPLPSVPSSSDGTVMSSGANSQGHHLPYRRSTLLEVPGDDINGWRVLAADIEGRHRLVSEIRQVLNAMHRGENLRAEDYVLFDPFINGVAELIDRHRDMRLDVDNMSYEELLALEERIGNVNTGLSEETILASMLQRKYISITERSSSNTEPCCICREEYCNGDDIGKLDCGHDFHTNCIKQWLTQKNLCPICKTTALNS